MDEKSIPKFLVVEFGVLEGVGLVGAMATTHCEDIGEACLEALSVQREQANPVRIYQLVELKTP